MADAFSPESTRETLRLACARSGLDPAGAELVRLGENALYRLAADPVVIRIARAGYLDDAGKEVRVARWLSALGVPAARLREGPDQPLLVGDHPVTMWQLIDGRSAGRQDVAALGRLLRGLHAAPPGPDLRLPRADMLGRVTGRIRNAPVPDSDKHFLLARCEDIRTRLPRLAFPLPPTVIHGDAHIKNVMVSRNDFLLIDFERFAWGQPEWDLAVTATEHVSAGWWTAAEYEDFTRAYGYDITTWDGFPVLRAANEIKMTTWLMQNVGLSPAIAAEYDLRLRSIRTNHPGHWTAF